MENLALNVNKSRLKLLKKKYIKIGSPDRFLSYWFPNRSAWWCVHPVYSHKSEFQALKVQQGERNARTRLRVGFKGQEENPGIITGQRSWY